MSWGRYGPSVAKKRTESERDDPVWDVRGKAAVAVEDVATEHAARSTLAEGRDTFDRRSVRSPMHAQALHTVGNESLLALDALVTPPEALQDGMHVNTRLLFKILPPNFSN